jgi:hypothetical protein
VIDSDEGATGSHNSQVHFSPRKDPLLNRLGIVRPDRLPDRLRTWVGRPVETIDRGNRALKSLVDSRLIKQQDV